MISDAPTYRHFYIVGPYDAEKYSDAITEVIDKYLKQKEHDVEHVTIIMNDDEPALKAIVDKLIDTKYKNIRTKLLTADFAKHRRKAYMKRNMKGMLLSTHILVLRCDKPTITQQYIMEEADNVMKSLLYKHVDLNKVEASNVEEKQESVS